MALEKIHFESVLPEPLEAIDHTQSQVWKKDFVLDANRRYTVEAPSGRGKSTFLHIIYGLRSDYSGSLTFDENKSKSFSLDDWSSMRRQHLSMIFQDLRLLPDFTVEQNLKLHSDLFPNYNFTLEKEALSKFGIRELMKKKAGLCSYGERQRVAIVRAICRPYRFLLMDEPFSHLDENNIRVASDLIQESLNANQAGFLMASLGFSYELKPETTLQL